jgi:hypothetical protein
VSTLAERALARTTDAATRRHLQDLRGEVARALDPSRSPAPATPAAGPARTIDGDEDSWGLTAPAGSCWPDYIIRPSR